MTRGAVGPGALSIDLCTGANFYVAVTWETALAASHRCSSSHRRGYRLRVAPNVGSGFLDGDVVVQPGALGSRYRLARIRVAHRRGTHASCLLRAMGYRVTTKAALRSNLLGYFLSSVTPFTAGGGPLQVYSLHRSGVPVGYATAAVLVNGFFAHFSLALSGTFIVFGSDVAAGLDPRIYQWLRMSIFVYMGVLLVLAFSVWHVERGRRLIKKVIWPLLRFFTDKRRARSAIVAVDKVVTDLHHGLRTAARHWTWALLGFVACFGYFAVFFAIVPTLVPTRFNPAVLASGRHRSPGVFVRVHLRHPAAPADWS